MLILKGTVTVQVNGTDYELKDGQGLFINRDALHMSSEMTEDAEYVSFNFPEKQLFFFTGSRMEYQYVKPYTGSFAIRAFLITEDEVIQKLYKLKELIENTENKFREYDISILITEIWRKLLEFKEMQVSEQDVKGSIRQECIQLMLTYIHRNYSRQIMLKDIAAAGAVSPSECSRRFKDMLRITPYEYLIRYRLARSAEMLADSDLNITEISERAGFNNVTHFIQVFRKYYSVPPKKYRENCYTHGI